MLSITDISIRIAGRLLIDDSSVQIVPGARVGFVGRNGVGAALEWRRGLRRRGRRSAMVVPARARQWSDTIRCRRRVMAARRGGHGLAMVDAGRSALVQQSRNRSDGNREYGGRCHSRRTGHLAIVSQARGSTAKRPPALGAGLRPAGAALMASAVR
jgi:hypothetical protein